MTLTTSRKTVQFEIISNHHEHTLIRFIMDYLKFNSHRLATPCKFRITAP